MAVPAIVYIDTSIKITKIFKCWTWILKGVPEIMHNSEIFKKKGQTGARILKSGVKFDWKNEEHSPS